MVTNNGNGTDYRGLSTDEKPTDDGVFANSLFLDLQHFCITLTIHSPHFFILLRHNKPAN